jgi:hypothetical protein
MFNLNNLFGNWRTTLFGIVTGASTYILLSGVTVPRNRQEWGAFVLGLLQAVWGAVQKDGSVGSKA